MHPFIKAYAASTPRAPLEPFSFDPGEIGPEEVEIKVTHCGICHSDLSMLDNEWAMSTFLSSSFCQILKSWRSRGLSASASNDDDS